MNGGKHSGIGKSPRIDTIRGLFFFCSETTGDPARFESAGPADVFNQNTGSVTQQGRGAEEEKAEQRAGEGVPQPADAQAEEGKDQTEHAEGDKEKDDHGFRCF